MNGSLLYIDAIHMLGSLNYLGTLPDIDSFFFFGALNITDYKIPINFRIQASSAGTCRLSGWYRILPKLSL